MTTPRKVLVTGANGFIGRALMVRYRALGAEVVGVDLTANPVLGVQVGNVAEAGAWQALASGCDLVIHTAAVVSNSAPAALYQQVSLGSVRHALDAAVRGGASRFLHLSSIAAYGLDFTRERTETDAIALLSGYPYCDAKAASEHPVLAAHAAGEMACTIVRPGDVYGPGSRPWVTIPLQMMRKHQFVLPAFGRGVFSPVYVDNLVDGIVLAAASPAAAGQIFNVTDGADVPCAEFFAHHWRWAGKRGRLPVMPSAASRVVGEVGGFVLNRVLGLNTEISPASLAMLDRKAGYSIAKARAVLGYVPAIGLDEGMALTREWVLGEGRVI